MKKSVALSLLAAIAILVRPSAASASVAAPVYEVKDADVSLDAVRCRCAGTPVLVGNDAFSRKGFMRYPEAKTR